MRSRCLHGFGKFFVCLLTLIGARFCSSTRSQDVTPISMIMEILPRRSKRIFKAFRCTLLTCQPQQTASAMMHPQLLIVHKKWSLKCRSDVWSYFIQGTVWLIHWYNTKIPSTKIPSRALQVYDSNPFSVTTVLSLLPSNQPQFTSRLLCCKDSLFLIWYLNEVRAFNQYRTPCQFQPYVPVQPDSRIDLCALYGS